MNINEKAASRQNAKSLVPRAESLAHGARRVALGALLSARCYRRREKSKTGIPQSAIRNPQSERGFTLLEMIIVLAIITILLSFAIPTYQVVVQRARETVLKQNLYLMRRQIEQFAADQGYYPGSLQQLVDKGYLKEIPLDPIADSRELWQEIPEEGSPLSPEGQPGIVDVKSGAEGISTEGTAYSEW